MAPLIEADDKERLLVPVPLLPLAAVESRLQPERIDRRPARASVGAGQRSGGVSPVALHAPLKGMSVSQRQRRCAARSRWQGPGRLRARRLCWSTTCLPREAPPRPAHGRFGGPGRIRRRLGARYSSEPLAVSAHVAE